MIQYDVLHGAATQDVLLLMFVWHDMMYVMFAKDEANKVHKHAASKCTKA